MAPGGAEALALLTSAEFDLVLLDLMMPTVDGMAVLTQLRKRELVPGLPVVVITAHDDRAARIAALGAGAVDFLSKPIDRLEVAHKARTLIELKRLRERALAAVNDELEESNHLLRVRFEQSPAATIAWDRQFSISAWNPAAERLFGYSAAEAIRRPTSSLLAEAERERAEAT